MGRYLIIFSEASGKPWWGRFLKEGFEHVFVLKDYGFCWEKIEHCINFVSTDLYLPEQVQHVKGRVIEIHLVSDPLRPFGFFHHLNCVSLTKKLIGVYDYTIQTPFQLYKHLLTIGGKPWEPSSEQNQTPQN